MSWGSFVFGVVLGAAGMLATGFLRAAGSDLYQYLKKRINPPPLEPVKVGSHFDPVLYEPGSCAWVREEKVDDYEHDKYTFYPHPKSGAKCFREAWVGPQKRIEFLMVRPDATRKA